MKYRVAFLTHKYIDRSDTPRLTYRTVRADSPDEAREIVRNMDRAGSRYIGMIHQAEVVEE